jgi:hypothetical protein
MSPRGSRQKQTIFKVGPVRISPDDVKFKMLERDRLAALDDRDEAARWLGDPPKHRSALAQRSSVAPKKNSSGARVDLWKR